MRKRKAVSRLEKQGNHFVKKEKVPHPMEKVLL
jgi:hypothetical protein